MLVNMGYILATSLELLTRNTAPIYFMSSFCNMHKKQIIELLPAMFSASVRRHSDYTMRSTLEKKRSCTTIANSQTPGNGGFG